MPPFRWIMLAVLIGALGISGTYRRRAEAAGHSISRRAEGGAALAARMLLALPAFGSVLLYIARPSWMEWSVVDVPVSVRWLGAALGVACLPMVRWTLAHLGSNVSPTVLTRDSQELVTSGPYRYVRHPLYTSGSVMFAAMTLMSGSWFLLLLMVVGTALMLVIVIPREEEHLVGRFGEAYRSYQGRTGRLLPRWRR